MEGNRGINNKQLILLYASDTVPMAEIPKQLQGALQIFENYCNTWKLKANKNTTKVVVFYRGVAIPKVI